MIARSERGLLAHLFSDLIEDQQWKTAEDPEALGILLAAAKSVGFDMLEEMLRFEGENGPDTSYHEKLREFTARIP